MTHHPQVSTSRDARRTRERLIRAALELFTTNGYHVSTTPQIAAKAGVAEGTIYRHFASKSQLLNELYRGAVAMFAGIVADRAEAHPTCQAQMRAIADGWAGVAAREPALTRLVFVSTPTGELDARSRTARNDLRETIENLLASGKAAGEVRPGPVEVWADVWMRLVTLVLERVAEHTWTMEQSAPRQVIECAWDSVGNLLASR